MFFEALFLHPDINSAAAIKIRNRFFIPVRFIVNNRQNAGDQW
jgi:hypothetical protein